jgi:voltage-gated potassium channel Kch
MNIRTKDMAWTAVTAAHEPKIMLFSGAELDFRNPSASLFTIEDVAHGLSLLCRYASAVISIQLQNTVCM